MRISDLSSYVCSSDLRVEVWATAMADPDPLAWRDTLPTAISVPLIAAEHPALVRALDQVRQHARIKGSILPWLGLSFALRDMGLTATPLPCIAGVAKAIRLNHRPEIGSAPCQESVGQYG